MTSTAVPNLVEIRPWGALEQIREILTIFRFLFMPSFLSNSPTSQTAHHILRLMAQMTQTHARVCLFWLWLILQPI